MAQLSEFLNLTAFSVFQETVHTNLCLHKLLHHDKANCFGVFILSTLSDKLELRNQGVVCPLASLTFLNLLNGARYLGTTNCLLGFGSNRTELRTQAVMLKEIGLVSEFPPAHITIEYFDLGLGWLGVARSGVAGQEVGSSECLLADIALVGSSISLELRQAHLDLEMQDEIARAREDSRAIHERTHEAQWNARAPLDAQFFHLSLFILISFLSLVWLTST